MPYQTHKLTNPIEQSPSLETNSLSAGQEVLRILCNLKVYCYCVHNSLALVLILSHINPNLFHYR